ncbi:FAD binding domain-containing protein [Nostocoides sp. Soil756]|uniref:xanthine dehydrogenase small subunit n=1 Tax=Nostocoides sp. Soil756 TaxID=1736399 RepID=UPI0006F36BCA|nr:FAD binding domain-containing protein [Tetrasphaera sp. Soil756]KRE62868.1 xanthine dehydrogenase small subunit [Tetrasphaera sp. Soil756]
METGTAPQVRVNGEVLDLEGTDPCTNALDWLRSRGLTGAKEGCAEGECGACAVMVARPDGVGGTHWAAVNACLAPAASLAGREVVTAEGLGTPEHLHPVQSEMAVRGGSQCGYCTPGFVCSMAAEYYRADRRATPTGADAGADDAGAPSPAHEAPGPNGFDLVAISGNLCRCTGYRPIRDAAFALGFPAVDDPLATPAEATSSAPAPCRVEGAAGSYVRPTDLAEALRLLGEHPDAVLVAGSTDWGVDVNLRGSRAPFVIGIDRLPELRALERAPQHLELGAALTLAELERGLAGEVPLLAAVLPQFASPLIRNTATVGGNLATGSPIGDLAPALLALEASVVLEGPAGSRVVPLDTHFTGYRSSVRRPDEVIRSLRVPLPLAGLTAFHKVAKRRFDDISGVAVGLALHVEDGVVARARIGVGGVAATPLRATSTEAALEGRPWTEQTVRAAAAVLREEGTPIDDHRASAAYRRAMLAASLVRLWAEGGAPEAVHA